MPVDEMSEPLLPAEGDEEAPVANDALRQPEQPHVEFTMHPPAVRTNQIRQRNRPSRILDRDAAFFQSRGRWSVQHISRGETRYMHTPEGGQHRQTLAKQFWNNWFHTLASQKTVVLLLILFVSYTTMVVLFAFVYLFVSLAGATHTVDPNDGSTHTELFCDLDIHDHMEALYFSLSTMTTIGYGVSDYYFGTFTDSLDHLQWLGAKLCTRL